MEQIGFGGGCHWCTEAVFDVLKGVTQVEQGWIASTPPNENLSEGVIVHYDADVIDLNTLIEIHLQTHASTANHSMRQKYRSAIYTFSPSQKSDTENLLKQITENWSKPCITQVLDFQRFKASEERIQQYYKKHWDQPFCQMHIRPKIEKIEKRYQEISRTEN